jgi:hypothetical protein
MSTIQGTNARAGARGTDKGKQAAPLGEAQEYTGTGATRAPAYGSTQAPRAAETAKVEIGEAASERRGLTGGVSPDQWRVMVAEAAYYRAERRGFRDGSPEQDWFEAEEEIRRSLEER